MMMSHMMGMPMHGHLPGIEDAWAEEFAAAGPRQFGPPHMPHVPPHMAMRMMNGSTAAAWADEMMMQVWFVCVRVRIYIYIYIYA
jgi:hypothetical protein